MCYYSGNQVSGGATNQDMSLNETDDNSTGRALVHSGHFAKFFELFLFNRLTFICHYHFYHLRVFVADHSRFAGLNLLLLQVQYCLHASFFVDIVPVSHFPIATLSNLSNF